MTEHYWQRYKQEISNEFMERTENKFWQGVKQDLARLQAPKHHLELYSMCKSENPYIKYPPSHSGKSRTPPTLQQKQSPS
jgi:hypothetical protein